MTKLNYCLIDPAPKAEEPSEQEKPPAPNIFGQAKPVDTSAREREIEQRLEREREEAKSEIDQDKQKLSMNFLLKIYIYV